MKNNIDSAIIFYNNALSKATNYNDSTEISSVLQNLGATFINSNKIDEAKPKLFEALRYSTDSIQTAKIYLNLAKVYSNSITDSAYFYISNALNLAEKNDDKTLQASIYYYRSKLDEKTGNYKTSLENYKKYSDFVSSVYSERQKANYIEVQNKYDIEKIARANTQLLIDKLSILILFLITILVLFTLIFLYYLKKKKNEKAILLAEREIYKLKEIIRNYADKKPDSDDNGKDAAEINKKMQKVLAEQFGILKKIALLENLLSDDELKKGKDLLKRIYTIIYGHSERYDWKVLADTINYLYAGYVDKLQKKAPHLKEIEFQICCLTKSGLSNWEIGSLLNKTENAIELQKTNIRISLKLKKQTSFINELDRFVNTI